MPTIRETEIFSDWMAKLRDRQAKAKIAVRIDRLRGGNPGGVAAVGGGVSEMKIDHGPRLSGSISYHAARSW